MIYSKETLEYPTPSLDHFKRDDYRNFYEPAEDSFLFLDGLTKDRQLLQELNPKVILEIGPGSGVVIVFLAQLLAKLRPQGSRLFYACDINRHALDATQQTVAHNGGAALGHFELINADRATPLMPRLQGSVDIALCNPPYVPTEEDDAPDDGAEWTRAQQGRDLWAAWSGGRGGVALTEHVIKDWAHLLSAQGTGWLIALEEQLPAIVKTATRCQLKVNVVMRRASDLERLALLRIQRK
jgi:release factor glutamine methyltransferase